MTKVKVLIGATVALYLSSTALVLPQAFATTHETILHRFTPSGADAASPNTLIRDSVGNLYGTSFSGGTYNAGTVFELSPGQGGQYTERILYSFRAFGGDGTGPQNSLGFDGAGNLYGTTSAGGSHGAGTVFELVHSSNGTWSEKVLYSFNLNGTDGNYPYGSVIFDAAGNLYSTTTSGGAYGGGTVFELTPSGNGNWTVQVLYSFGFSATDGFSPYAGLVFDGAGNLYGTTNSGGPSFYGTVFELSPSGQGNWTESILYNFTGGADGGYPQYGSLVFDPAGNIYGTTSGGGANGHGTVFELTPEGGGQWTEQVLHSFQKNGADGYNPLAGLTMDGNGNLFGTTTTGGTNNWGTVFEVSPAGGGNWTERILHSFNMLDGADIWAGLFLDSSGNLFGAAITGGVDNAGTIFELTPSGGGSYATKVLRSFNYNGTDGGYSQAPLIMDGVGNLYGTTVLGGRYDGGTVFEITSSGTEIVLHHFGGGRDGGILFGGLTMDAAGNLYGTTAIGGAYNDGTVFEMSNAGTGWTERILHSFNLTDGFEPFAGLVFDQFGNLYGTTLAGGTYRQGTAFELMPTGGGNWMEQVLHNFNVDGTDGAFPQAGLLIDRSGNLYGTTFYGGSNFSFGAVFELSPAGGGNWTEQILHSFNFDGTDGTNPLSALAFDAAGNLYGTTTGGGADNGGVVFELSRNGGGWAEQIPYSFGAPGDGSDPQAGVVLFPGSANLFGTTYSGGTYGAGTVYELTPTQGGNWIESILYSFNPAAFDGANPDSSLIFDISGNHLYGTTYAGGGVYNSGTVFSIGP